MDQNNRNLDKKESIIPGYEDAAKYSQDALRSILYATKASNDLPAAGDDFDYYSTFQGFRTVMLREGQSILSFMTSLIQNQGVRDKFQGRELEEKFDLLIDVNDMILEHASSYLDEASGVKKSEEELVLAVKPQSSINTSWNKKQFKSSPSQSLKLLTAKNVTRPQLSFKDKIDNTHSVFVPIIKEKPNSIRPLAVFLEEDSEKREFCHPYEVEIEKFEVDEKTLEMVDPIPPKPLEETPIVFVKTEEQLKKLCSDLKSVTEFAVDLEHHSYRSFQGFTCLMQISTREKDYIVDVLELRSELYMLNEVFTDPKIVKVFHGADMDVLWLQRDFGIYIVNLFDTGQAARLLQFAHLSLSYLLKHYCKLDLDKQFQLADWRMRPLPNEMVKYARQDTHYLLFVYDCMKNDLISYGNHTKNLLVAAFQRSKLVSLKRYTKPVFTEDKYLELYKKSRKMFNAKQLFCLKELYSWRDQMARENDESIAYILPNHMLLQIAEALPREQQGILACCNPIPPLVKQQLNELHSIVLKATVSSYTQLAEMEEQSKAYGQQDSYQIDLNSMLHCPHDILHIEEKKISETLDSELPIIRKDDDPVVQLRKPPSLKALFEGIPKIKKTSLPSKVAEALKKLISPYERYQMTEELRINEEERNPDVAVLNESDANQDNSILEDESLRYTNPASQVSEGQKPVVISQPDISSGDRTPLRKKSKKKKRKAEPDVPLNSTPVSSQPPAKKSKTPDIQILEKEKPKKPPVITLDDNFTPYDYSQTDLNAFSGKKKGKNIFNPQDKHNFKAPGKHIGRNKKHFKQASYSGGNKKVQKSWPKKN